MAKDLLYRPNLGYEKNYYTEGKINNTNNDSSFNYQQLSKKDIIDNLINSIDNKIKYLPSSIVDTYLSAYDFLKEEYKKVLEEYDEDSSPSDPNPKPEENPIPDNSFPDKDKDKDDDDIPIFDRTDDFYIEIVDPWSDPVSVIKSTYYVNFIDIYEDYLNKINDSIQTYIMSILEVISTGTMSDPIPDYNTKAIKNESLYHLSDYLIKSNIVLQQSLKLHKKIFNLDEIILHIRAIRINKEQMIRYNSINEMKQNEHLDIESNIILKESRRISEKKYEENLYALYKYLNSSVILLNESFKTMIKQNVAISAINKNEKRDK